MTKHNLNFSGASIGGVNIESHISSSQIGTQNNYSHSTEDVTRLLSALRNHIQEFPSEKRDEALNILDTIGNDLNQSNPDQSSLRSQLKRLATIAAAVGTIASGGAAFTGDLNNFAHDFIEFTETIGIPIEQTEPKQLPSP